MIKHYQHDGDVDMKDADDEGHDDDDAHGPRTPSHSPPKHLRQPKGKLLPRDRTKDEPAPSRGAASSSKWQPQDEYYQDDEEEYWEDDANWDAYDYDDEWDNARWHEKQHEYWEDEAQWENDQAWPHEAPHDIPYPQRWKASTDHPPIWTPTKPPGLSSASSAASSATTEARKGRWRPIDQKAEPDTDGAESTPRKALNNPGHAAPRAPVPPPPPKARPTGKGKSSGKSSGSGTDSSYNTAQRSCTGRSQ